MIMIECIVKTLIGITAGLVMLVYIHHHKKVEVSTHSSDPAVQTTSVEVSQSAKITDAIGGSDSTAPAIKN
jgi:hypothetical protein